jgi:3-deoxy-7-phosphoheptulonate synthase
MSSATAAGANVTPSMSEFMRTGDSRIQRVRELVSPRQLLKEFPVTSEVAQLVSGTRAAIRAMIHDHGHAERLLVIVGPCSIHDPEAALQYAQWLSSLRDMFADTLLLIMRVYFEKPRTQYGWKGLINDPCMDETFRSNHGLRVARRLLLDINSLGVPTATEFLDPITLPYMADLISWGVIGARTVESQVHRELASGLSCPVGFKNGTEGNVGVAINAVLSASRPQSFLSVTESGAAAIVSTVGNPDGHIVLRGGAQPNYHPECVASAVNGLRSLGLAEKVIIDCSHGNCQRDHRRQLLVAEEVAHQIRDGSRYLLGLMAESNLVEGRQFCVPGKPLVFGQSVTDPCIGLDTTTKLLDAVALAQRFASRHSIDDSHSLTTSVRR